MKAGPIPAEGKMPQRFYRIRRAFLFPLGVDAFLLLGLWVLAFLLNGTGTEKLVFTLFFVPTFYLFLESLQRRVTVTEEGITVQKLWRSKTLRWEEITHVGCLVIHKKIYLLLTTLKGFFIVSNAYETFSDLVEEIMAHVEPERIEEEVRLQTGKPPAGISHIVLAWIAALFMIGIILMKLFPLVV
ncbi:MAG: PH domain-containing protein [Deltaproteobacteria bacterium]|nr:PH domain-containing protein [Deltaproteobacteria bacterium]